MTGDSRYLLALYLEEQDRSPPLSPGRIAERLDRSPAAVTEMLQRMADRGLVTYEPYEGATLTPAGRSRATEVHERYVVLIQFFDEVLTLDDPEPEARQFVGVLSKTVTDRLATTLLDTDRPTDQPYSEQAQSETTRTDEKAPNVE